jgi:hypothetical protein
MSLSYPYVYAAGTAVSIPITIAVTDVADDLQTIILLACATIPVLSSTPFGPIDVSYSRYSFAPGDAEPATANLTLAVDDPLLQKDTVTTL